MKILQIVDYYKPFWGGGGVTRSCYEISTRLASMGHDVTVYSNGEKWESSENVEMHKPVLVDGVTVYYFKNISRRLVTKTNIDTLYRLPLVARKNLRQFDVIHMHTFRSLMVVPIWYYARKYSVPYIYQTHGALGTYFEKKRLKSIFDVLWGNRILNGATKYIALTSTEIEQYKNVGAPVDKIIQIPNGIDLSTFDNLPTKGIFRKKHDLDDNEKIVLFLGRIHRIKGIEILVEAFAELIEKANKCKLIIVGPDDGLLSSIEKRIKELGISDKVLYTGALYGTDKLEAYVDADIFVLPSMYETFPTTVLEACMCGIPVVLTDRCGIADIIDNQMGYVVEYNRNQLLGGILKLLNDDKLRSKFAEKGKGILREKFNWDEIVKQIEKVYLDIVLSYSNNLRSRVPPAI